MRKTYGDFGRVRLADGTRGGVLNFYLIPPILPNEVIAKGRLAEGAREIPNPMLLSSKIRETTVCIICQKERELLCY